jgi:alkylhydroperoxidase family enzyme
LASDVAGASLVDAVKLDLESAPASPKLRALLALAGHVQESGRSVTRAAVLAAKAEGATDQEIHDTVLIAAAFCMYNRYVDGLGTIPLEDDAAYAAMAPHIVEHGYVGVR